MKIYKPKNNLGIFGMIQVWRADLYDVLGLTASHEVNGPAEA